MSMNIDTATLGEVQNELYEIIDIFNNASMTASEIITNAGGASMTYRRNIISDIDLCASDIAQAASNMRNMLQELNEANRKSEEGIGGFIKGIFNFLGNTIKANSAMQTQSDLQNAAALTGLFDMERANELSNAANEQANVAVDASNEAVKEGKRLGTTIVNGFTALVNGITRAGEVIGEGMLLFGAGLAYNEALYYSNMNDQYKLNLKVQEEMLDTTAKLIVDNHTEELFVKLYENEIMKEINNGAYIKYGDKVYMRISGVTQCISVGTLMTVYPAAPFVAGVGNATEETLQQMKYNSKEGVRDDYNEGKISAEELALYEHFWNLSEEEIHEMKIANVRGEMSDEDWQAISAIINMEDEWTTKENYAKAATIGVANGAWEMVQYGVGMNNKGFFTGTAFGNAVERVGIDTLFNGLDIPYRSAVSSLVMGTTITDEINRRGGLEAINSSLVEGLFTSAIGEGVQALGKTSSSNKGGAADVTDALLYKKGGGNDTNTNNKGSFDKSESIGSPQTDSGAKTDQVREFGDGRGRNYLTKKVGQDHFEEVCTKMQTDVERGKLDLTHMSEVGFVQTFGLYDYELLTEQIRQNPQTRFNIYPELVDKVPVSGKLDENFSNNQTSTVNGSYGSDQGAIKKKYEYTTSSGERVQPGSQRYKECIMTGETLTLDDSRIATEINYAQTELGYSAEDAKRFVAMVDIAGPGGCTYQAPLMHAAAQGAEAYQKATGASLYNENGEYDYTKGYMKMVDFVNAEENGGNLSRTLPDGTKVLLDGGEIKGLIGTDSNGRMRNNDDVINAFYEQNGSEMQVTNRLTGKLTGVSTVGDIPGEILDDIDHRLDNQDQISITLAAGAKIYPVGEGSIGINSAHDIPITGRNDIGFLGATYGKRVVIPYQEIGNARWAALNIVEHN